MEIAWLAARRAKSPVQLPLHGSLRRIWQIPVIDATNSVEIVRRTVDRRQICRVLCVTFCSKLTLKSLYLRGMTGGHQIEQWSSTKIDPRRNRLMKGLVSFGHNEVDAQHGCWGYQRDLEVRC